MDILANSIYSKYSFPKKKKKKKTQQTKACIQVVKP